ncbi:uncharacterized protein OCT59_007387 [Rhizophagus irregularis]|uniref:uncharacterized protein n=1 Tax=Rhizophagus irregularis TaxID=588596 RepID=UPI000CC53BCA|nr:hypothetical protein OCT59_007387 [Rhizophagus irregularis]
MLAPYNGANEEDLREALHNQKELCEDKKLYRYRKYCIEVDSKYDLNSDRAPVLAVVAKNDAKFGTPLVFRLSNKENNWITSITLKSLKNNIPYNDSNCEHK